MYYPDEECLPFVFLLHGSRVIAVGSITFEAGKAFFTRNNNALRKKVFKVLIASADDIWEASTCDQGWGFSWHSD